MSSRSEQLCEAALTLNKLLVAGSNTPSFEHIDGLMTQEGQVLVLWRKEGSEPTIREFALGADMLNSIAEGKVSLADATHAVLYIRGHGWKSIGRIGEWRVAS